MKKLYAKPQLEVCVFNSADSTNDNGILQLSNQGPAEAALYDGTLTKVRITTKLK
jgi:hypothetical protein